MTEQSTNHRAEAERLAELGAIPPAERDYTADSLDVLIASLTHAVLALDATLARLAEVAEYERARGRAVPAPTGFITTAGGGRA